MRLIAGVLLLGLWGSLAQAACRQALVLGLDVSSSVDAREYALQMNGLAGVLADPEVQSLLLSDPNNPIMLAVFEWAGQDQQHLIVPWMRLTGRAPLAKAAALVAGKTRSGGTRSTAIGRALSYAGALMQQVPDCWQHVIDISGDGKNNDGYRPRVAKQAAVFDHVVVNGLVIGKRFEPSDEIAGNLIAELTAYYHQQVLHGPNAFLETALGFDDFARAMKKKILREAAIAVSTAPSAPWRWERKVAGR